VRRLDDNYSVFAVGAVTGRYFLGSANGITVLDPVTLLEVKGSPIAIAGVGQILVAPDEQNVYVFSGKPGVGTLSQIDGNTLLMKKQTPTKILCDLLTYIPLNSSMSRMALSCDGLQLFLAGTDANTWHVSQEISPIFSVFDTNTLKEPDWVASIQTDSIDLVIDMTLSPLGDRLFATSRDEPNPYLKQPFLFTVDAYFPG
jgi:hypothetical protein